MATKEFEQLVSSSVLIPTLRAQRFVPFYVHTHKPHVGHANINISGQSTAANGLIQTVTNTKSIGNQKQHLSAIEDLNLEGERLIKKQKSWHDNQFKGKSEYAPHFDSNVSSHIHAHYLRYLPFPTISYTSLSSRVQLPKPSSHISTFSSTQIGFVNKWPKKLFSFMDECNPLIFDPEGEKEDKDNQNNTWYEIIQM